MEIKYLPSWAEDYPYIICEKDDDDDYKLYGVTNIYNHAMDEVQKLKNGIVIINVNKIEKNT